MEEWIHALEEAHVLETQAKVQAVGKGKGKRQRSQSNVSDSSSGSGAVNSGDTSSAAVSSSGGLTHQRAQECFVAANSHSARLQRKHTAAAEERSFRQMEFPEFLEALVHVAARIDARSSLAHNIDTITIALRKAVDRQSQDTAYQRATSLMERIDFKMNELQ